MNHALDPYAAAAGRPPRGAPLLSRAGALPRAADNPRRARRLLHGSCNAAEPEPAFNAPFLSAFVDRCLDFAATYPFYLTSCVGQNVVATLGDRSFDSGRVAVSPPVCAPAPTVLGAFIGTVGLCSQMPPPLAPLFPNLRAFKILDATCSAPTDLFYATLPGDGGCRSVQTGVNNTNYLQVKADGACNSLGTGSYSYRALAEATLNLSYFIGSRCTFPYARWPALPIDRTCGLSADVGIGVRATRAGAVAAASPSPSPSALPSGRAGTQTGTPTPQGATRSATPPPSATSSATPTPTPRVTGTALRSGTASPPAAQSPSQTPTASSTPSLDPSPSSTASPGSSTSSTPSATPSASLSSTAPPSASDTPSPSSSDTPSASPGEPSLSSSSAPTPTGTPTSSPTQTRTPTASTSTGAAPESPSQAGTQAASPSASTRASGGAAAGQAAGGAPALSPGATAGASIGALAAAAGAGAGALFFLRARAGAKRKVVETPAAMARHPVFSASPAVTVANPMAAAGPPPSTWRAVQDAEDTWYENVETGETAWTLPQGAELEAGGRQLPEEEPPPDCTRDDDAA